MVAMEVILDSEKKFIISMEEFAALLKVYDTFGLGHTKRELIINLEIALFDESLVGNEEGICGFTLQEKEHLRWVISKFSTLTDEQAKKINDAMEKADELFSVFYFFNPLERVSELGPFKDAVMERLNK